MDHFFPALGHWIWLIAAGVLLILELMAPGIFLIWLGIAAAVTGVVVMFFDIGWQAEFLLFAALAVVSVLVGRRVYDGRTTQPEDNPHLNRRQLSYVGRSFTLKQPLVNGRGKLSIDDTVWEIEGPDMAPGTRVTVTAVNDMVLVVSPA
jgi:membrane protein implicated in regulation of membrane protease activity